MDFTSEKKTFIRQMHFLLRIIQRKIGLHENRNIPNINYKCKTEQKQHKNGLLTMLSLFSLCAISDFLL